MNIYIAKSCTLISYDLVSLSISEDVSPSRYLESLLQCMVKRVSATIYVSFTVPSWSVTISGSSFKSFQKTSFDTSLTLSQYVLEFHSFSPSMSRREKHSSTLPPLLCQLSEQKANWIQNLDKESINLSKSFYEVVSIVKSFSALMSLNGLFHCSRQCKRGNGGTFQLAFHVCKYSREAVLNVQRMNRTEKVQQVQSAYQRSSLILELLSSWRRSKPFKTLLFQRICLVTDQERILLSCSQVGAVHREDARCFLKNLLLCCALPAAKTPS